MSRHFLLLSYHSRLSLELLLPCIQDVPSAEIIDKCSKTDALLQWRAFTCLFIVSLMVDWPFKHHIRILLFSKSSSISLLLHIVAMDQVVTVVGNSANNCSFYLTYIDLCYHHEALLNGGMKIEWWGRGIYNALWKGEEGYDGIGEGLWRDTVKYQESLWQWQHAICWQRALAWQQHGSDWSRPSARGTW